MEKRKFLILPKKEWYRLKQNNNAEENNKDQRNNYFRNLNEESQNWIRNWHDSVEGQFKKVTKEREKRYADDIAFMKLIRRKKNQYNNTEAVRKAKEMIFDESCYGRQLLSALIESKVLEEREAQIKFRSQLKEQGKVENEICDSKLSELYQDEEKIITIKQRDREIAELNKAMASVKITEKAREKAKEIELDQENARITQRLLENEKRQEKVYREHFLQKIKEFEKEQKSWNNLTAKREKLDNALIRAQTSELERKHCKIKSVLRKLHQDKQMSDNYKNHYKLLKTLQDGQHNKYETFIQSGINKLEKRKTEKDQVEHKTNDLNKNSCYEVAQFNKITARTQLKYRKRINKSECDRQCIINKPQNVDLKSSDIDKKKSDKEYSFLRTSNKMLTNLKQRQFEDSPWNGLKAAHAHFAQRANNTLSECTHKIFGRKVIDEYRKTNNLDSETLHIPNYF